MVLSDTEAVAGTCLEGFRSYLLGLDVTSEILRNDPTGRTWLEPEFYALTQRDAACREVLEEFVEEELELFGSVRERGDPLFTKRVLEATAPTQVAGSGLDPRLRSPLITVAYAAGILLTLLVLIPLIRGWLRGDSLFEAALRLTR